EGHQALDETFVPKRTSAPAEKLFACSKCDLKLVSQENLRRHMSTTHAGLRAFDLDNVMDKEKFKKAAASVPKAKKKAKRAKAKKFSCSKCGKKFISKGGFEYHMNRHAGCTQIEHRAVRGKEPRSKVNGLPKSKNVVVFTNSSGLSKMRDGTEAKHKVPEQQSYPLFEDPVKEEQMEEEDKVPEQKFFPFFEEAVKKEETDDEEPGPSWELH
ncbi:hypothetical protein PMAYCL1PPCAC_05043, partial [Pristionchus mayeri]